MYSTDDFKELSALHKAILAAKFSGRAINDELAGDPTLAGVSDKIYEELGKIAEKKKIGPAEYWEDWRRVKTSQGFRGQWRTAVIAARRDPVFRNSGTEDRMSMAKCYLSPFTCTEGELRAFLDDADGKTGEHNLEKLAKEQNFSGATLLECSCELAGGAHVVLMLKTSKVCDIFFSGLKKFEITSKNSMGAAAIDTVERLALSGGKTNRLEAALTDGRNKKTIVIEADSADYWI